VFVTGDVAGPFTAPGLDDGGLDRTLAHAGVGAFVVAADERITFWNQADEAIMSYTWRESATPIWCFTTHPAPESRRLECGFDRIRRCSSVARILP
jgi:PAS domain-containing protein